MGWRVVMAMIHLIEDDDGLRHVVMNFLILSHYQVKGFSSAESYICYMNKASFECPSLILSDVNMPGVCGLQLARKVREYYPEVRYMLMTGDVEQLKGSVLSDLRIEKVFRKPFSFLYLEQALHAIRVN